MNGRAVSPITRSLRPAFQIGAGISIAETNCDDARASTEVSPPSNRSRDASTITGGQLLSRSLYTLAPRRCIASSCGPIGR